MAISLTESAAERVSSYLEMRGHGVGLRVGVKPTGCSGYSYVVNYADSIEGDDVVFEDRGVKIVVDPEALKLIDGAGDRPFLLYLSHYIVHGPIQGKPEKVAKQLDKAFGKIDLSEIEKMLEEPETGGADFNSVPDQDLDLDIEASLDTEKWMADAGGNDLLLVGSDDSVSLLAVFPLIARYLLNLLRAFAGGGYADLHRVAQWNLGFARDSQQSERYMDMAARIQPAVDFMAATVLLTASPPRPASSARSCRRVNWPDRGSEKISSP